uniref:Adenosine 5'-monophosphoramidase HINT3 n=1 Tax=Drosophila melanogaster TaxID=7227 RepID=B3DMY8_DROME|nr:IP21027p [Drosophila melanogaster]
MADDNCIFCLISDGRIPSTVLEVENDDFVIFQDIKPASQHHYLAVTKKHYASLKDLNKSHDSLVQLMENALKDLLCPREFLSMMPSSDSICRRLSR